MNICSFLFLLWITMGSGFFIKYPFGKKFSIKEDEINKRINYELPEPKQEIINKINGIYALIGPNINIKKVTTLFDLFIGDGMIQSVFFDKGELTYVKHFVRTEKLIYEETNGKLPTKMKWQFLFTVLHKFGIFPNSLGVANTALLASKNKIYALYERDHPYLLDINFSKKQINTKKKIVIPDMHTFSAHSKYNGETNTIETIDNDIIKREVHYHELDDQFNTIKKRIMPMKYLPIVHDFFTTVTGKIIVSDSPFIVDFSNLFRKTMPIMIDREKSTFIHILHKLSMSIESYEVKDGFYLFHYADYKETEKTIEIYASLYNKLDFSTLNISGKYRKIVIQKDTKNTHIEKSVDLEAMNLEFPVKIGEHILLRKIERQCIVGFVLCKELEIVKEICFEDKFISGEPALHYIDSIPYIITFAFTTKDPTKSISKDSTIIKNTHCQNSILVINLQSYEVIEIPIDEQITIGFHSTFLPY